ncbi:MAG: ABC transporter ATP-binding protein [Chloroflexota bacterium]|nr:MAG: ABC transporter ATP-binding protein [Chloroflexota bacterium]
MSITSETAILFSDVNKRFKYSTDESESILDVIIASVRRKPRRQEQILWAVQDATFSVAAGESIALVGRNGSGKSTILKLTAGILRPSSGRVEVRGRLSAMLELGAGFHPDLTGQENIRLNASILGLTNAEIDEIYDEIIEFSELGEFINMPVKHYSSGMYMRLGFSVAVHIAPDVLLIDEILAVGDQSFQDKCIERLHELKASGTTVVFVSHNPSTVLSLCERALWIEDGQVVADGPSSQIVGDYLASQGAEKAPVAPPAGAMGPISGDVELVSLRLLNVAGQEQDVYQMGEGFTIELDYLAHRPIANAQFDLSFQHQDGAYVGGPGGRLTDSQKAVEKGPGAVLCRIDSLPLLPAAYHITASVYDGDRQTFHDHRENMFAFRVTAEGADDQGGLVRIPATWETIARHDDALREAPARADSSDVTPAATEISSDLSS